MHPRASAIAPTLELDDSRSAEPLSVALHSHWSRAGPAAAGQGVGCVSPVPKTFDDTYPSTRFARHESVTASVDSEEHETDAALIAGATFMRSTMSESRMTAWAR